MLQPYSSNSLTGDLFSPDESPPLEIRFREKEFEPSDRDFFTQEFRSLQEEEEMEEFPSSQIKALQRTFYPSSLPKNFGQSLQYHAKASWDPQPEICEQFFALDMWHNWLIRYGFLPYSQNWEQFYLAYWLSRERFPLPFGDAGFRELHHSLRPQPHPIFAKNQLFYQFATGRIKNSVDGIFENGDTKFSVSFKLPNRLEAFTPIRFELRFPTSPEPLYRVKTRKIILIRPHPQFPITKLADGKWLALLTFTVST
jgi:hypothetical protein